MRDPELLIIFLDGFAFLILTGLFILLFYSGYWFKRNKKTS